MAEHTVESWGGPKLPDGDVDIELPFDYTQEEEMDEAADQAPDEPEFDYAELLYDALGFRPGDRVSAWDGQGDPWEGEVEHIFAPGGVPMFIRLRHVKHGTVTVPFERATWESMEVTQRNAQTGASEYAKPTAKQVVDEALKGKQVPGQMTVDECCRGACEEV